jgi:hypothetical protein
MILRKTLEVILRLLSNIIFSFIVFGVFVELFSIGIDTDRGSIDFEHMHNVNGPIAMAIFFFFGRSFRDIADSLHEEAVENKIREVASYQKR